MTIALNTLQDFFENTRRLRRDGRVRFDVDGQCKWSFFFVDSDESKLLELGRRLEELGYEIVGLLRPAPEDEDQKTIYLRADRIETHSLDSLHARNAELDKVALRFGVDAYDGMDVGAVDGP